MSGASRRSSPSSGLTLPEVVPPLAAYQPAVQSGVVRLHLRPAARWWTASCRSPARSAPRSPPEEAKELARTCALNALAAVKSVAGDLDRIARVVKVVGFVASAPDFTGQPGVHQRRQRAARRGARRQGRARAQRGRRGGAAAGRAGRGRDPGRARRLSPSGVRARPVARRHASLRPCRTGRSVRGRVAAKRIGPRTSGAATG